MKIDIPYNILLKAGIINENGEIMDKLVFENIELSDRVPAEVTGSEHTNGVMIYVAEKWFNTND